MTHDMNEKGLFLMEVMARGLGLWVYQEKYMGDPLRDLDHLVEDVVLASVDPVCLHLFAIVLG